MTCFSCHAKIEDTPVRRDGIPSGICYRCAIEELTERYIELETRFAESQRNREREAGYEAGA